MERRRFLGWALGGAWPLALAGTGLAGGPAGSTRAAGGLERLGKPHAEWRKLLQPEVYAVLFEEDTERPFSSPLNDEKRAGTFVCAACFLPLFESRWKYDSGTGWPSFWDVKKDAIGTRRDVKLFLPRTEYHCRRCGGHQGHVFDDGPKPTGLRYCNNGLALRFVPEGESLPPLRT
jgi:peptide-methionine (R)-S-oxide reductase